MDVKKLSSHFKFQLESRNILVSYLYKFVTLSSK